MSKILMTGATGNVGREVIRFLLKKGSPHDITLGVRDTATARRLVAEDRKLNFVNFDFENPATFRKALHKVDRVFLLRPPNISDTEKHFRPLVSEMKDKMVNQVVFLSVQGAEKSKVIPHNRIESLIIEYGMEYIFLRPGYFMQNLTTTLLPDIIKRRQIFLPRFQSQPEISDFYEQLTGKQPTSLREFIEREKEKFS